VAVSPSGLRRVRVGRRHLLDQGGHAQRRARKLPQFAGAGADGSVPGHWAIKGGDATQGALKVYWDGKRAAGYAPMKKQGVIIRHVTVRECSTMSVSSSSVEGNLEAKLNSRPP